MGNYSSVGASTGSSVGAAVGMGIGGPAGALIGAGVGTLAGGLIGSLFGDDSAEKAQQAIQAALAEINAVGAPPELADKIIYKHLYSTGNFTPEQVTFIQSKVLPEAEKAVVENPEILMKQRAQMGALEQLSRQGMGLEDVAAFQKAQNQAARNLASAQQDVLRGAQQRGQSSGGAALLGQLLNAQQAAQMESDAGLDIAARAAEARRAAINQAFNAADTMRQRDTQLQQYNKNMKLEALKNEDVYSRRLNEVNVGARNQANLRNLDNVQGIANQNVGLTNQQMRDRVNAQQWAYQQQLARAQARANAQIGQANYYQGQAAANAQNAQAIASGIGQTAGSIGQAYNNQKMADAITSLGKTPSQTSGSFQRYNPEKPLTVGNNFNWDQFNIEP